LTDFLVERDLQLLRISVLFVIVFEEFRYLVQQVSLPLGDLIGIVPVLAGQFDQGLIASDRLQSNLGFEIGGASFVGSCVPPLSEFWSSFSAEQAAKNALPLNRRLNKKLPLEGAFFMCAPGRAHLLGGESPIQARQGELLSGRQGCPPRGGI